MLRKLRIAAAVVCFALVTLLFLDFTGTLHAWFGWLARIQFLPALLAVNVGVVLALVALTLLFGRVYCSVICPLGVMQDIVSWASGKRRKHRNRFAYSPALTWLRRGMLVVFVAAMLAGVGSLLAPYSAYGRIAHWIVHNEVDGGVDWTNMGDDKLVTTYTNAYVKSMRLCASIVRQYDANAEFFASFSHSWSRASNPGWYPVRDMVGLLGDFSRAEGDFRWALACHSYPETISDPCTWREPNATFAMNTPFVTLKNLEVLSKWALTPANLFRGTTRRSV